MKNLVTLRIRVTRSGSTCNTTVDVMIQVGKMKGDKVSMMLIAGSDYNICISIDDLIRLGTLIDCQQNSLYCSKERSKL